MEAVFSSACAQAVLRYLQDVYRVAPEFLWAKFPNNAALRHPDTRKWFGALINLPRQTLHLPGQGRVDILDLKCDPLLIGSLLDGRRYLPAYHMNKEHWMTLLLDGSIPEQEIFPLIDLSYQITAGRRQRPGACRHQESSL